VFVAELERALLAGQVDAAIHPLNDRLLAEAEAEAAVDMAVHSLKDVPGALPEGLVLGAITHREDPRDVLVTRSGHILRDLPQGARIATSSLRRRAQLLHTRPDLRIEELRGNVDTRVRKALEPNGPDGVVLAAAGVKRLGLEEHVTEYFDTDVLVPAVGQGALAVEVRRADRRLRRLLRAVDDTETRQAVLAERAVLRALRGGCQVPLGAHASTIQSGSALRLVAVVATPDGARVLRAEAEGSSARPVRLGQQVASALLRAGAEAIIQAVVGSRVSPIARSAKAH
jgi:hydroxymethylbilane synthase